MPGMRPLRVDAVNPASRYMRWRRGVMRPQGTDTRKGSIAAELAGAVTVFLCLTGVIVYAGEAISVLAALVILFGTAAAWSCAYVFVGALVDALVNRRRR